MDAETRPSSGTCACGDHVPDRLGLVSRRAFVVGAAAAVAGCSVIDRMIYPANTRSVEVHPGVSIVPRANWGGHLRPQGTIHDEGDVQFLLVHHTAGSNNYGPGDVIGILNGIYSFHTGPKGWADVAYNFFVDRYGTIYEGRTGSLERAKVADATGGSQGFAQLCCLIGDHSTSSPTLPALDAMGGLLAWLARRHRINVAPGATTSFTSRGSNLHPRGARVTTATIAGHRNMSATNCPGDAAYRRLADGTFARLAVERT